MSHDDADDLDAVEMDRGNPDPDDWAAVPSPFTCPECHGILFERQDGTIVRYRCRTGHAFSADTLAAAQSSGIEEALWIALRALEENAALFRRLSERFHERGQDHSARRVFIPRARRRGSVQMIRDALISYKPEVA